MWLDKGDSVRSAGDIRGSNGIHVPAGSRGSILNSADGKSSVHFENKGIGADKVVADIPNSILARDYGHGYSPSSTRSDSGDYRGSGVSSDSDPFSFLGFVVGPLLVLGAIGALMYWGGNFVGFWTWRLIFIPDLDFDDQGRYRDIVAMAGWVVILGALGLLCLLFRPFVKLIGLLLIASSLALYFFGVVPGNRAAVAGTIADNEAIADAANTLEAARQAVITRTSLQCEIESGTAKETLDCGNITVPTDLSPYAPFVVKLTILGPEFREIQDAKLYPICRLTAGEGTSESTPISENVDVMDSSTPAYYVFRIQMKPGVQEACVYEDSTGRDYSQVGTTAAS